MNQLFLLKLIDEMLDGDKPSPEKIHCAKTIIKNLIEYHQVVPNAPTPILDEDLDREAALAKAELLNS